MEPFKKSLSDLMHCLRIPIPIDIDAMRREFEEIVKVQCKPTLTENKKRRGWKRYVVYRQAEYLRPGEKIEFDFSQLIHLNNIISQELKGSVLISAMYAIIPPKGFIGMHRDGLGSKSTILKKHIEDSIRLHIPIYTNKKVMLYIGDQFQRMQEGEFWMLNNYSYHGVINQNEDTSRNHLIFDVIPSPEFLQFLKSIPEPKGFKNTKVLKRLLEESNAQKSKDFRRQLPWLERTKLKMYDLKS